MFKEVSYVEEVSYGEALVDKSTLYIRVTLYVLRVFDCIVTILFGVYLVLWLF